MVQTYIFLVILSVNFFRLNGTNTTYRRCETKFGNGTIKVHCCDNHETKNGLCVECTTGFISDMGEPCQQCGIGLYGRKCGDICKCNAYEICNHVIGCLNFTYEVSSTKLIAGSGHTDNAKTPPDQIGSLKKETALYVVCTSVVTFVLTMCLVTLKRYRKRRTNLSMQIVVKSAKNENNANEPNQAQDYNERVYDTIDESQIIEMPTRHPDSVESSLTQDDIKPSDGYLNPYQPMEPDPLIHDYSKVKPLGETDPPQYINVQGEHVSLHRLVENDAKQNTSVTSSPSSFLDKKTDMKRSDYISMH
ncbi:uncharacterized protein LOC127714451 [Mytilus californianus]|uniref:uncharacterized protein LOC127714451 n=1 Tax=Mytilus californianus TaxID=6549 RepID=UPI00224611C2|nr:uncharacterized protein LOC127714451 [Mytilus californianus]